MVPCSLHTVISTSPSKRQEAVEHLGADEFLVSRDAEQMKVWSFDLGTVPADRNLSVAHAGRGPS